MDTPMDGAGTGRRLRADFWKRAVWTVGLLALAVALWFVPLVGVETEIVSRSFDSGNPGGTQTLGSFLMKALTLRSLSFAAYGITYLPFALALVLLSRAASGRIERLLDGSGGWSAVERWAERLSLPLSFVMAPFVLNILIQKEYRPLVPDPGTTSFYLPNMAALVAGTAVVLLISGQITKRGLGNGALLLLALPHAGWLVATGMRVPVVMRTGEIGFPSLVVPAVPLLVLIALAGALVVTWRRIPVLQAQRAPTSIELGLCPALIWPLLAARTSADFVPYFTGMLGFPRATESLQPGSLPRLGVVLALTAIFAVLGSRAAFNPSRIAATLEKSGAFIPGLRPGRQTEEFLAHHGSRLHLAGIGVLLALEILEKLTAYTWNRFVLGAALPPGAIAASVAVALWLVAKSSFEPALPEAEEPSPEAFEAD